MLNYKLKWPYYCWFQFKYVILSIKTPHFVIKNYIVAWQKEEEEEEDDALEPFKKIN